MNAHPNPARQEAVCAAMRAKVATSIDRLLEDARLAPCLAEAAFHNAVLALALAGVEALQAKAVSPKYRSTNQVSNQTRKARHAQHVHHH